MINHFELICPYYESEIKVIVQRLSQELPHIYAVWPKDKTLKTKFDDAPVFFLQFSKPRKNKEPIIWHKVNYSKNVTNTDLEFETTVWEKICEHESMIGE